MTDFHQNGNIAQFHNLRIRPVEELARKISLILPALFSELEGPALGNILRELAKVRYLHRIIIGLDAADEEKFRRARDFFKILPQNYVVIWNNSPRMKAIEDRMAERGLGPHEPGKGKNVWTSIGYLIACADSTVVALHDCDILTYKRDLLARLLYPVCNPGLPYQLSKGYYARVGNDKMNGRVVRLLVSPILIALKNRVKWRCAQRCCRDCGCPLIGALRSGFCQRPGAILDAMRCVRLRWQMPMTTSIRM